MSHYISITEEERRQMLAAIGVEGVEALFNDVPAGRRFPELKLPAPLSEAEIMRELRGLGALNANALDQRCFLGAGAYHHFIPSAVDALLRRAEFYTAYTPYQPEISQGTLQVIFEYQSLICALTGMDVANASHYDGATALAEAAVMAVSLAKGRHKVLVSPTVNPQYRQVLRTFTQGLDLQVAGDDLPLSSGPAPDAGDRGAGWVSHLLGQIDDQTAAIIIQTPDFLGNLHDLRPIAERAHAAGVMLIAHVDPIALGLFQSPGSAGADIVTAEGQPLGIPLSYGGPYLGVFACKQEYVRRMPGRLAGATTDMNGRLGYVLTLQTREQHIRREKATSSICTNQGLMALAATIYMCLMGKSGMRRVAALCYHRAHYAAQAIAQLPGYQLLSSGPFFKEFVVRCPRPVAELNRELSAQGFIGGYDLSQDYPQLGNAMLLCVTEMNSRADIDALVAAL